MRTRGFGSAMEPWACPTQVFPDVWAGDAVCLVILLRSTVNAAHQCRTAESRAPEKSLSIWGKNCVLHRTHDEGTGL